jgi:hypothetical protein
MMMQNQNPIMPMKQKKKPSKAEYNRRGAYWMRLADTFPNYEDFKSVVFALIDASVREGRLAVTTAAKIVKKMNEIEDRVAAMP